MSRIRFLDSHFRFPTEIIEYTIRLYYHSRLTYLEIEEMLVERGILVSYESIRGWCNKYGPHNIKQLTRNREGNKATSNIDCVHVTIHGQPQWLWRSFDEDGNLVDVYTQSHRNSAIAKHFLGTTVPDSMSMNQVKRQLTF